jgi:regulator of nonsense transcripts 2
MRTRSRVAGEFYNYRLINSEGIFGALYMILTLGYDTLPEGDAFPACDAPDDCFRVRLIVTLLETCGSYFDRGASRAKLDRFLAYFQRYVLAKPCLPIDQAFDVADLFGALRPKLVRHERFEDACAACAAIEAAEAAAEEEAASAAAAAARAAPGDAAAAAAAAAAGAPAEEDSGSDDDGDDGGSGSDGDDMDADDADGDADGDEDAAAAAAEGGDAFDADAMDDDRLDDDDDKQEEDEEEEEEELSLRTRRSVVPKEEEDAFARELSAALGEAPGGGGASKPGFGMRPLSKGALPLLSLGSGSGAGGGSGGGAFGSGAGGGGAGGATVSFKMLTRRDGRNSTRELHVPIASEMATVVAAQQEAEEAERSELKRLVLDQVALSDSNAAAADAAMHPAGRVLFSTAGVRGGDRYRRKLRS